MKFSNVTFSLKYANLTISQQNFSNFNNPTSLKNNFLMTFVFKQVILLPFITILIQYSVVDYV